MSNNKNDRHVLLCVCGGVAAYKAVEVLRELQRAGCEARVACTQDSLRFVGAATWEGLVHHPVATSVFDWPESSIPHVELAGWAHAVLVVPATANVMAKMAAGIADDMVSTTLLAVPSSTPVIVAPAMNVHMWQAPATQHNVRTLEQRGVRMVMPATGALACEGVGEGRLADVEDIAKSVLGALDCAGDSVSSLADKTVLVTAGPTHEAIDPVRYIANASSGKMGYAIAAEAARRGARVVLVSGPCALPAPAGVERKDVVSAAQMYDAATSVFADADVAICAAAVADYTPANPADHKLKKGRERLDVIELVKTSDILAELGRTKEAGGRRRVVVGFAAETEDLIANAAEKLKRKNCDLIVANNVTEPGSGFGTTTNRVTFIAPDGAEELPLLSKDEVAKRLMSRVEALLATGE